MERLIAIGVFIILLGFFLVVLGTLFSKPSSGEKPKVAVGGFIGFIPFGFANDRRMMYPLFALMAGAFFFWLVLSRLR